MHLRTINMHVELELLADALNVLQSLLVIRPGTTNPDLRLVFVQGRGDFTQGADDAFERRGDVGEVGDAAADEEDFALWVYRGAEHEIQDGAGVVVGLGLGGCARVFAVVGEFGDEAGGGDGVSVDDGGTAAGDESPDATGGVEHGEFERRTGLGVHVGDVLLFFGELATEWCRELHGWADVDSDFAFGLGCCEA